MRLLNVKEGRTLRQCTLRYASMLLCGLMVFSILGCEEGRTMKWDFEKGADGLAPPGEGGSIVPEPGAPGNHAYQIATSKPHHTRLGLAGSEQAADFMIRLRVKVLESQGEPPNIYVYGRSGKEGFRGLVLGRDGGRVFCYYGQQKPSITIGSAGTGVSETSGWVHVAFACVGEYVFGKSWRAGQREPRWQTEGPADGLDSGAAAVGVWTSPRTPSSAKVLFDDIEFVPLTPEVLKTWGIRPGPRPDLPLADVPKTLGTFQLADRIGLASNHTAVAFDRETGEITNIVDLRTGGEFIAREYKEPLFRVTLSKPYQNDSASVTSRDFRTVRVHKARDNTVRLQFDDHPDFPLGVRAAAKMSDDGMIRLWFQVRNESDWCIARASFPGMPAPAALGKGGEEQVLVPWHSGGLIPCPGSRTMSVANRSYPGSAFAQFYAYYGKAGGLYVGMYDSHGHCKRFHLRSGANRFVSMALEHLFPELPGEDVELKYDVVLRTFQGDWRDAAAIYKTWAVKQPWCAKPLAGRDDIPQFLKDGAGIIIAGIANPVGRAKLVGERLEKLPDLMDAYRKATGLKHMVFVPYGWENRGTWAGINYFPAVPSDDLWRRTNAELKKRGHRTAFLTSGYWWVVKRKKTGNGPAFDDTADFERRKDMCVAWPDGSVVEVDWYDRVKEFGSWRGLSVMLCHGSPKAQSTMKDIFLNVARLGVPLVSFDQEIGGGQRTPCYSKTHGHPPGYGHWMWTDFRDVCAGILKEGKPIQPELGLFLENVSELAIPYMATYWSRQFGEIGVGGGGGRGVGLFSYLYHEYVTAIGAACVQGQGAKEGRPDANLRCRILANNLTRGLIPGPFMHDVPLKGYGIWAKGVGKWQGQVSRAYCSFCRPYAHFPEYLLLGKTVRPIGIECEDVETYCWRRDPKRGKPVKRGGPPLVKEPLILPAVTVGSFQAADGSAASFIVNSTPEERRAVAVLPPGRQSTVYSATRKEEKKTTDARIPLVLEPFGVCVIVTR